MNAEAMVIRVIHRFPDADAAWADTLDYLEEMGSPIITVAT